jgi:hypothetical protein
VTHVRPTLIKLAKHFKESNSQDVAKKHQGGASSLLWGRLYMTAGNHAHGMEGWGWGQKAGAGAPSAHRCCARHAEAADRWVKRRKQAKLVAPAQPQVEPKAPSNARGTCSTTPRDALPLPNPTQNSGARLFSARQTLAPPLLLVLMAKLTSTLDGC